MEEPKVELKNIKTFRGTEGTGFNADIYINGIKCMFVIDSADGGMYHYETNHSRIPKEDMLIKENIKSLEDYVANLPLQPLEEGGKPITEGGKQVMLKPDLDTYINDKYIAILMKRDKAAYDKSIAKRQIDSIVIGKPGTMEFTYFTCPKALVHIEMETLQRLIDKIKEKHCKDGVIILNTNLSEFDIE